MRFDRRTIRLGVTCLLLALTGCQGCVRENPQLTGARLTGTVRFKDGKPLPGAEITLIGVDDPAKHQTGFVRADGAFDVPNVPLGELKVTIDTHSVKSHPALIGGGDPEKARAALGGQLKYVPIDKKYADPAQTPLRVTVNKGDNQQDFQVD